MVERSILPVPAFIKNLDFYILFMDFCNKIVFILIMVIFWHPLKFCAQGKCLTGFIHLTPSPGPKKRLKSLQLDSL